MHASGQWATRGVIEMHLKFTRLDISHRGGWVADRVARWIALQEVVGSNPGREKKNNYVMGDEGICKYLPVHNCII